jgi:hypothetical protein
MSDAEVIASAGATSKAGEYILRRLPSWMPRDESTGNFKLLDTVGRAIDRLDGDIIDTENANTVQHAETGAQLEELAKLVDLAPKESEAREKYRSRVISEFQTVTSEGTPATLIENTATVLDVKPQKIGYRKVSENGAVELSVPGDALDAISISSSEFVRIIGRNSAAGFRIEATIQGTFTYISPSSYSGGDPYDPAALNSTAEYGHDGLDSNGDPKENGGTYAGLIE